MPGLELKYFVLKPKGKDAYADASRKAMIEYALTIQHENKDLCAELMVWVAKEAAEAEE